MSAADLALIARHYEKPISYFFPPGVSISKDELSPIDQELLSLFQNLPVSQQYIVLEYAKQQLNISINAFHRMLADEASETSLDNNEANHEE